MGPAWAGAGRGLALGKRGDPLARASPHRKTQEEPGVPGKLWTQPSVCLRPRPSPEPSDGLESGSLEWGGERPFRRAQGGTARADAGPRILDPQPNEFSPHPVPETQVSLILNTGILSPLSATFLEFLSGSRQRTSTRVSSGEGRVWGSECLCAPVVEPLPALHNQSSFSGSPNIHPPPPRCVCVCVFVCFAPSVVVPSVRSGSCDLRRAPRKRSSHTPALNPARALTLGLISGGRVPKDKTDHALDMDDSPARTTNTSAGEFGRCGPCARVVGACSPHPTVTQATLPIRCAHPGPGHLVAAHLDLACEA